MSINLLASKGCHQGLSTEADLVTLDIPVWYSQGCRKLRVTPINFFTVRPDQQRLVDLLVEATESVMKYQGHPLLEHAGSDGGVATLPGSQSATEQSRQERAGVGEG